MLCLYLTSVHGVMSINEKVVMNDSRCMIYGLCNDLCFVVVEEVVDV